jgi:two-component system response regulator DegU
MNTASTRLNVMCVDDQPDIREMLKVFINRQSDMACVECAEDAESGLRVIERRLHASPPSEPPPFIVLMDLTMPGLDPLEATRTIVSRWPSIRVLICSAHEKESVLDAAVEAGAWGVVSKHRGHEEIIAAIRAVGNGQAVGVD